MLHIAVAGLLINFESRVFPPKIKSLWKEWQLKVFVVSSLGLQVALILSGKRRKRTNFIWFRFFVWSTYLLADWVATVALGLIANDIQEKPNDARAQSMNDLMAFWAPFLLIHLGGPDTITAYSMEDNELWQRRTLELLTQAIATVYIFLLAWPGISWLSIITFPMLIVGLIKFGERVAALRSASSEQFRDSLLTPPDPGPNYAKFMEDFTLKKAEGFSVKAEVIVEASAPSNSLPDGASNGESESILKAYSLFQRFKRIFVDLILSFQDRDESQSFFIELKSKKAFRVIEVELGLIYDTFYTKAPVVYSANGCVLRFLTIALTLIVLILFPFTLKVQDNYAKVDLVITYILMGGAILLEIIALFALVFSDWARYWLINHYSGSENFLLKYITGRKPGKRWSDSMAQYSLLKVCLEEEQTQFGIMIQKLSTVNNALERSMRLTYTDVSADLKDLIFTHCHNMSKEIKDSKGLMEMCRSRGDYALKDLQDDLVEWDWSMTTTKVEFDQSILLWHIATELCYYCDKGVMAGGTQFVESSKHISDYMLYLLAMCPFMLPVGIGLIRFRDTCAEAKEFFKNKNSFESKAEACKMLLRVNTEVSPSQVKGDRSKSVLFDACKLATKLRDLGPDLEDPTIQQPERKWLFISKVWVEILGYAAIHCRGAQHAQQLRKGGELLTHVWLLMAHLGITEQLQIAQGHARAKLNVK